jgi:hypothetical protein
MQDLSKLSVKVINPNASLLKRVHELFQAINLKYASRSNEKYPRCLEIGT